MIDYEQKMYSNLFKQMKSNTVFCCWHLVMQEVKFYRKSLSNILLGGVSVCRSVNQVCVEKSLVFRTNTPYHTDTVSVPGEHDLLFCVQLHDCK